MRKNNERKTMRDKTRKRKIPIKRNYAKKKYID